MRAAEPEPARPQTAATPLPLQEDLNEAWQLPVTLSPTIDDIRQWCAVAARAASAKKGEDPVILAVGPILVITDAFVIASGANARQVRTIVEEIELRIKLAGGPVPLRIEGLDDARWVLMDYGDFVVHVFLAEARDFYELERLWADADRWAWQDSSETQVLSPLA